MEPYKFTPATENELIITLLDDHFTPLEHILIGFFQKENDPAGYIAFQDLSSAKREVTIKSFHGSPDAYPLIQIIDASEQMQMQQTVDAYLQTDAWKALNATLSRDKVLTLIEKNLDKIEEAMAEIAPILDACENALDTYNRQVSSCWNAIELYNENIDDLQALLRVATDPDVQINLEARICHLQETVEEAFAQWEQIKDADPYESTLKVILRNWPLTAPRIRYVKQKLFVHKIRTCDWDFIPADGPDDSDRPSSSMDKLADLIDETLNQIDKIGQQEDDDN